MAATSTVPRCLALLLLLHCVSVTFATPVTTTPAPPSSTTTDVVTAPDVIVDDDTGDSTGEDTTDVTDDDTDDTETDDVTEKAMRLISDIRQFTVVAKKGMALASISEGAEKLKERAEKLLQEVSDDANGCETNFVIKMAAARIGSPEILALLQAEDQMGVLNARLSMSFGFLESVAQMIEDELALSTDIAGHLEALTFGADTTDSIAQTSDTLLRDSAPNTKVNSVAKRQWSVGVNPSYTNQGGLGVTGSVGYKSKNGRLNWNVSPSWSQGGGFGVGAGLTYTFGK